MTDTPTITFRQSSALSENERIRLEQDFQLAESLEADKIKESQAQLEEAHDKLSLELEARCERMRSVRKIRLPAEPNDGFVIRIRNGASRRFKSDQDIKVLLDFVGSQPDATENFTVLVPFTVTLNSSDTTKGTLKDNRITQSATIIPTWISTPKKELTPGTSYEFLVDSMPTDVPEEPLFTSVDQPDVFPLPRGWQKLLKDYTNDKSAAIPQPQDEDGVPYGTCYISVRRRHILVDTLRRISRMSNEEMSQPLCVCFQNETAVDEGGPRREFGTLLMQRLANSRFMEGREGNKTFAHDVALLNQKSFFNLGRITAALIVQGGPGLPYFSPPVASYITSGMIPTGRIPSSAIADPEMYNRIEQVEALADTGELRAQVDHLLPERFEMGFRKSTASITLFDVPDLISAVAYHTLLVRPRAELDQFREGLDLFGVKEWLLAKPDITRPLFEDHAARVTSRFIENLFEVDYSPVGTNRRDKEEDVFNSFLLFVDAADRGEVKNIDDNASAVVTPAMVLQFFTGCDREPPGGFPFTPKISFNHDANNLPTANTCAGRLILPVCDEMVDPDRAIQWFGSILLNSLGFGLV